MATQPAIIPLPWHVLVDYLTAFPGSLVVDQDGRAQYPHEWAHDRRHYKPSEHERYAVIERKVWLTSMSRRLVGNAPMWCIAPAPAAILLEQGANEHFDWVLSDDDRLTFFRSDATRLVVRLMPNHYRASQLDPIEVYRTGAWDFEDVSRAMNLADRIAERLSIRRAEADAERRAVLDISFSDDSANA